MNGPLNEMNEFDALVMFVLACTKAGIRTNEDLDAAMLWIAGEDWRNNSPSEWKRTLMDRHNICIEGTYGEFLDKMFEAYYEHNSPD